MIDCACVCVRSGTDGVSRGGDQVAEQTTQQIPQSFSVRCVFFFCVCVCVRERERDKCMLLVYVKCVTVCVSCSPQCCASLRHTVNCQDGVTSSS